MSFININALNYSSPKFEVPRIGFVGHPIIERIESKFQKAYTSDAESFELLVFYELQPIFPIDHWLADVGDYIKNKIVGSPFKRVWIYSVGQNKIMYM